MPSPSPEKKKIPRSSAKSAQKEGPLNSFTFVITGRTAIDREELSDILKDLGARVTAGVSGKTTYLVYGDGLEDGREVEQGNKYIQATKLGKPTISVKELEHLVQTEVKDSAFTLENYFSWKKGNLPSSTPRKSLPSKKIKNQLWPEAFAPTSLDEIVGNQAGVKKFTEWLEDWNSVVLKGKKKRAAFRGRVQENINAKACLISGPPGIGKTSLVRLVAKMNYYSLLELNASDQRNKARIKGMVGFATNNLTIGREGNKNKTLILLDEVDGMAGNEDRGGIAALIEVIKNTKTPIVCVCNDRYKRTLRSLVNHCLDIKFTKPDKMQVVERLSQICESQGVSVGDDALNQLVISVGSDIRQCLNFLGMWFRGKNSMEKEELKEEHNKFSKDGLLMNSAFDVVNTLLTRSEVLK